MHTEAVRLAVLAARATQSIERLVGAGLVVPQSAGDDQRVDLPGRGAEAEVGRDASGRWRCAAADRRG